MTPEIRRAAWGEHAAWVELFKLLRESGAVTEADAKASARDTSTPGLRLCAAIREWGEANATLAKMVDKS